MRLSVIPRRRARQITSFITSVTRQFQWTATPKKHFKIDDEERLPEDYDAYRYHVRPRDPWFKLTKMILLTLLVLTLLVFLVLHIIYKPPNFVINYLQRRYPDVLFKVDLPPSLRVVALTIDDSPSSETGKILDLLKEYGAKATFFVIGEQIGPRKDLLQRMHDEGHEIGNHAWADEPSAKVPLSELERQIKEVEIITPSNPGGGKYFRPGSGFFTKALVERVKGIGYKVVLGSIYPHDPQIHNARINANHVVSTAKPGGIIIMHDRRPYSARQLELILKGLIRKDLRGWTVDSLGGLLRLAETVNMIEDSRHVD